MVSEILLAASVIISPVCQWDRPGANRFVGDVPTAVHHYIDIPANIRNKLEKRLTSKKYDDIVEITKDRIVGRDEYVDLRSMHFGNNQICQSVTRDKWTSVAKERGLVYCEEQHCIIVPIVCGNISRVTRLKNMGGITPSGGPSEGITIVDIVTPLVLPPLLEPVDTFHSKSTPTVTETTYGGATHFPPPNPPIFFSDQPGWCCCIPVDIPATPEPAGLLLMSIGLLALWYKSIRSKSSVDK